jgi:glutathione synthase/RimK-type ligase-like ATP-grasp enzyme
LPPELRDEDARNVVVDNCRATLLGMAVTEFRGVWISEPEATRVAENKLVQLRAAQAIGFRLPRTLVSQDPAEVRRFCRDLDFQVIVKPVVGTPGAAVMTGRMTPAMLTDEDVSLCPAIYQELVPGTRHLRICCFGDEIHTALITANGLDWRYPLDAAVDAYDLDAETARRVRGVVARLGLRMGILDMKLATDGEPVWLEINPQGQFLFLEGLCGMPLTEIFADYLLEQASTAERENGTITRQ